MPAMNPGNTRSGAANPSTGAFVIMGALSGPSGSPLDKDSSNNASTGALSTGIGIGATQIMGTAANAITLAGWTYGYSPGAKFSYTPASIAQGCMIYIGGGRSNANSGGIATPNPYTTGTLLCGFGNGITRDAGAGPNFTGFAMRMSTATATVANGAAIEVGWNNASSVSMASGQSAFGLSTTAQAAPA